MNKKIKQEFILGIDVSKNKLSIHNSKTNIFEEIGNDLENLEKYFLKNKTNFNAQTHKVGLESTGDYSFLPMKYFFEKNFTVILINPFLTKKYNKYSVRNKKTDKSDSELICKMVDDGEGHEVTKETLKINKKTALRTEQNIVSLKSDFKRLKNSLELKKKNGIETDYLLKEVNSIIHSLNNVSKRILEKETSPEKSSRQEKIISSIPGFGLKLSAIISSEFGDIKRFYSPKQMVAFAGFDPSIYQSGNKLVSGRVSKRGSALLRKALYQAAFIASRYDPQLREYYLKKKKEGKHHSVILCAISRKLIHRIFTLIQEDRMYEIRP